MPLSLKEQFRAADAVTLFGRLFALDQIRTDYLGRVEGAIPHEDIAILSNMTDEMSRLLGQAEGHAGYLRDLIALHPEELDKGYIRVFWTDALSGDQKMRMSFAVERHGNLIQSVTMSAEGVIAGAQTERETLTNEMEAISRGGPVAGDLSSAFLCNMAIVCIGGGLLSPPPMNIVGVTVGLLMMGPVYARGEEC